MAPRRPACHEQNVFDDFHAAADWLVDKGLAARDHLAVLGRSNGGLLVGVALTQRPDLCRAVWCGVPLLDMIRFPQFLIARLWTSEYGDPDVAEEFAWLHTYSPYHHVVDGTAYPATLFTTAEGDSRVDPLHARKMAALVQAASAGQDERPVLLFQEGRAGHGVGKPVAKRADELADGLAFLGWQIGLERRDCARRVAHRRRPGRAVERLGLTVSTHRPAVRHRHPDRQLAGTGARAVGALRRRRRRHRHRRAGDGSSAPATPMFVEHPIGAIGLDHVVVTTDSLERTSGAIAAATDAPLKRVREVGELRPGFHRVGGV